MIFGKARIGLALLIGSSALIACDGSSNPPSQQDAPAPQAPHALPAAPQREAAPAPASSDNGAGVEIAGLRWSIPDGWRSIPASGMRAAEYRITAAGAEGEAVARFFTIQGSAEANVQRWKGQIADPVEEPVIETAQTPQGLTLHTIAATGTYSGMGPSGAATPPQPGTRFLGVYVEGGPRPVQVVLTGPDALVRSIEADWKDMLMQIRR